LKVTPGVSGEDGTGGVSVYGSTGLESSYVIDGVNSTSIESGLAARSIDFDAIEKIQVNTGGYSAEYGGAQGAVVTVVTKSGGNEFHGSLSYQLSPDSLAARSETNGFGTQLPTPDGKEISATFGGYLVKDRLFFFASIARQNDERTAAQRFSSLFGRRTADSTDDSTLSSFKLTWQATPQDRFVASIFTDPREVNTRDELAGVGGDRRLLTGGTALSLLYSRILGHGWYLEAQTGSHSEGSATSPTLDQERISPIGPDRSRSTPSIEARLAGGALVPGEPSLRFGPYAYSGNAEGRRMFYRAGLDGYLGRHTMKFGAEIEDGSYHQELNYGWGTGMALEWSPAVASNARVPEQILGVRRCWGDGQGNCLDWDHQVQADASTLSKTIFAQDEWKLPGNVVVNYGLRVESQAIRDDAGSTLGTIDGNVAPRLGVTWDPSGEGRSKLYGSAGRYFDEVPMQVVSRAFSPRITSTRLYRGRDWTYLDFVNDIGRTGICAKNTPADDQSSPSCWDFESRDLVSDPGATTGLKDAVHTSRGVGTGSASFRPDTIVDAGSLYRAPIDPKLKGASTDEKILGYDWGFAPDWTVGVKGIRRHLHSAIEDISLDFGKNYIIGNPGGPYRFYVDPSNHDLFNPDYEPGSADPSKQPALAQLASCKAGSICELSNGDLRNLGYGGFPNARRDFKGLELNVSRAESRRIWFEFSYLRSRTVGNYRGRYFVPTEKRDPNLTEAFDVPALVVNANGFLPQDREHQVKLFGNVRVTPSFNVGATLRYASGAPVSATTDPQGGSTPFLGPIYLLPQGTAGRLDPTQNVDLRLAYEIADGGKMKMSILLDIFNAMNEQRPAAVDEQFIATGLWRGAFYSQVDGKVEFAQEGRGEPYDGYIDREFGNQDGVADKSEWDRWARSFDGRFRTTAEAYRFFRKETTNVTIGGTKYTVPAYPGFESCPKSLPDRPGACPALNRGYGNSLALEPPRTFRLGVRLSF
ncbi:MAG TPA: TonB-dependent receptor plug domain-containing protein, partial [Verrucomicrobiae bacterium]|nr:TonB-dependent receptor plug domain-containing protein [Verrucomicrobiae bacterium]